MASRLTSPATAPGRFGPYGGRYVPETLMVPLFELERAYELAKADPAFQEAFQGLLKNFAGRPTPLQFAAGLTKNSEVPAFTSSAKTFYTPELTRLTMQYGQGLLAVRMGKPRIIAETGAGNTEWPRRRSERISAYGASCTWERKTWRGKR